MNDGVAEDLQLDLREEFKRLREEQDRLRREQERLKEQADRNGKGADDKQQGQDEQQGQGEQGQGGEQKPDDKKKPDDQKKPDEQKDDPKKKPANWIKDHPLTIAIIVVVLIAAVIGGFLLMQYLNSYVSTDDAQVDGHLNAVTSRIAGVVVGVYMEDNQTVKAGQTLVDLDPRDFKVAIEQAKAQLLQSQAGAEAQSPNVPITRTSQKTQVSANELDVVNADAGVAAAEQQYQAAIAQLRQAEANALKAQNDEKRYRLLVEKDEVSREAYDERLTAARAQTEIVNAQKASADAQLKVVKQRQAAAEQARERVDEARQNAPRAVEAQRANLVGRQADAQRSKAALDQAYLNLSYAKIAAPVSGVVGRRSVEVGQQVSPGQQLAAITNLDDLWITANYKETQLRNMHSGQSVTVHVDALNANFEGYLESLAGASGAKYSLLPPENATGNYVKVVQRLPIRIRLKPDQTGLERLRPGMSVVPKVWVR